jgi:hypothetical protein
MNLNSVVAPIVAFVNPPELITIQSSVGYVTNADGTRTPNAPTVTQVLASVQLATYDELQQNGGINLSGENLTAYIPGNYTGVIRADQKDGDIIIRPNGRKYLVVAVPEDWQDQSGWTKVLMTRQMN